MSFNKCLLFFFLMIFCSCGLEAALKVSSVTPSNGSVDGGNIVMIKGSKFTHATEVNFGTRPATSFSILTDTTILATVPAGTVGTVDVTVLTSTGTSNATSSDFYTYTQLGWEGILSVTDQNSVTLFNTSTNLISATVPIPVESFASVISPDGTTIYVIDSTQPNVLVIDAATNTVTGSIPLPAIVGPGGFDLIISPNGEKIYISNNISGYVTVVNTITQLIEANIFVVANLGSLSITPDGSTVYVANFNFTADNVAIIDTATNTFTGYLSTGLSPGALSITPDGTKGFIGNSLTDTVSVVDIATNTVTNSIALPAGSGPYGTSILPNGKAVYVANIYNDTVTIIDVATETVTYTLNLAAGSSPFWLAATPDSKTVYVANLNTSNVTPVDVLTNSVGPAIASVPGVIQDIVMSPDQAPVASFYASAAIISQPVTFDASASLSPVGSIVNYQWNFGDGFVINTSSPIVNHTFTSAKKYTVSLTVTNSAGTSSEKVFSSRFMSNNGGPTAIYSQKIKVSLSSPINLCGVQRCMESDCHEKVVNILTWNSPIEHVKPAYYAIYRDAALIKLVAEVPGNGPLKYKDRDVVPDKVYRYYVVAVSYAGTVSPAASVGVAPLRSCCHFH